MDPLWRSGIERECCSAASHLPEANNNLLVARVLKAHSGKLLLPETQTNDMLVKKKKKKERTNLPPDGFCRRDAAHPESRARDD